MSMMTATRWSIATLVFLAIGWADVVHGHRWGLALLVGALLVVYFFGGHGPRPRPGSDDGPDSDPIDPGVTAEPPRR